MQTLLWLLLPVAAASGWWMALYSQKKNKTRSRALLNSAYGQGLNYLLNEEPDKATEILVQMVEVDPDTVELHLALGSLFRRRGEVDRAIRVHQNIIARAKLSEDLRTQATLELGRDFLKAGLLDRAEQLLLLLLERGEYEPEACQHLIDLYQQQKEWGKALEIGQRLVHLDSDVWRARLAQYHCEIGDAALQRNEPELALQAANQAREQEPGCVRATLLTGYALQHKGEYLAAIASFQGVEQHNPELMPEVIDRMQACYAELDDMAGWHDYLDGLVARNPYLVFAQKNLLGHNAQPLAGQTPRYRCEQCGFTSRKLFWRCPGCQCWSSVKPIKVGNAE